MRPASRPRLSDLDPNQLRRGHQSVGRLCVGARGARAERSAWARHVLSPKRQTSARTWGDTVRNGRFGRNTTRAPRDEANATLTLSARAPNPYRRGSS